MILSLKNYVISINTIIYVLVLTLFSFAQAVTSEVLNIRSENNELLIDVAKRYPDIKLLTNEVNNQIILELKNSRFHDSFSPENFDKSIIISALDFLNDFEVMSTYEERDNLVLTLSLKQDKQFTPKLKSTIGNVLTISFLPKVSKYENIMLTKEDISNLYNQAVENHLSGNQDEAEKLYNNVIANDSKFYFARFNLAKLYLDKQLFEKSIDILESLIIDLTKETYDKKILLLFQNTLGTIYFLTNSYDKAIDQYESILKIDPAFYHASFNIALVYEKLRDLNKASIYLKKVIEIKPNYPDAYYHIGIIELIKNKKRQAINNFKKVIELAPGTKLATLSNLELEKIEKK